MQFAVDNDYVASNPLVGLKVPRIVPKVKRRAFRPDELSKPLEHPVYAKGERTKRNAGEALYWLPMLSLYSGARLGELAQMRHEDVREHPG